MIREISVLTALMITASPALAQTVPASVEVAANTVPNDTRPAADDDAAGATDVVVTARRREERPQGGARATGAPLARGLPGYTN